ncbi:hypothetical protein [Sphingopyxis sp. GC21]|uniref:hypothetical protein n=1 Tax=Sphingopyxis sp. GC21 TaxID=2933562 RepID=UPI0021E405EC|nr:hypothetical protein [Sphingopyxis sp. GC21]
MLRPSECFPGFVEHAEPLTLVLPRAKYEQRALTFTTEGKRFAMFLSGSDDQIFRFMECNGDHDWRGVLIPGIEIEIDEQSLVDTNGQHPPLGSLVRHADTLSVQTIFLGNRLSPYGRLFPLIADLPSSKSAEQACFTRWHIVLGGGQDKRVLHTVDVTLHS